jgi:UDP-N-acetylmuramate--alanine ligase
MNFGNKKNIYMIGIKGVGMAMLAQFLKGRGAIVSGSDVSDIFPTDKTLSNSKIKVKQGFSLKGFPEKIDIIIHSSAFALESNIEMKYFEDKNIPTYSYAEALGFLFDDYFGISVCGSHGKTTVTSWLGYVLYKSKILPNVLTGSYVKQFRGSALVGKSKYFLVESDEYQNKLKYFNPKAIILNNIDFDHPDYFKNDQGYIKVFSEFIKKIPKSGFLITNMEDKKSSQILQKCSGRIIGYYIDKPVLNKKIKYKKKYQAKNCQVKNGYQFFDLFCGKKMVGEFKIFLPGRHNILNALAVISSSLELGVSVEKIKKNLASFTGAARRFDVLGSYNGAIIIDDYAHHPSEIKASLEAVKQKYPDKKIITVFHPHTFSRTKFLLDDFSESFVLSNDLYLIEIYSSAREKKDNISSLDLIKKIRQYNKNLDIKQKVAYFKDIKVAEKELKSKVGPGDVVLFLGAGDVFKIAYNWLNIKS